MFKELFTEAVDKADKPLTATERKTYERLKVKKSNGAHLLTSKAERELKSLEARANIVPAPVPKFELASLKELISAGILNSAVTAMRSAAKDQMYNLKYLAKNKNLAKEDEAEFFEEMKPKIIKMFKSPALKKALITKHENDLKERDLPYDVIGWVMGIISNGDIVEISRFDSYSEPSIQKSKENWNSTYGHHTTEKANVEFYFGGKEYKKEFKLNTTGTSW